MSCSGVNHIPVSSGRRKDNPNRGEGVHHIGYRGPLSNQYKVITVEDKKVRHTIHVDWDLPSHGLENALSKEHLEAILEEADLGSVSQLMALENTAADSASNDEQLALNGAIDGLLEILPDGNSGPNLSYLSENDIEIIGKGPNLPEFTDKDIQDILHNQPQVVITPIPSQGVAEDKGDNDLNLSQLSELQDGPLFGSDDHGELDSVNVVEGHRNSVPAQPHNVSSFHMSHDMAVLEAQVEAVAHLAKEIPLQQAFGGPDRTRFIDAWKMEVKSILRHTAVPIKEGHAEYEAAVKEATSSRFIANEKRDGRAKFRWVVQGCFESLKMDDWTHYAHVATLDALRAMIFRKDRRGRTLASVDIRTAFLQSDPYGPHERARYIKVKDPFNGEWLYYRLITPMYGQRSAPRRWEDTLAPWLESQGFIRGENDASIFHRPSDDLTILVYVDDLLCDGDDACVKQFLIDLATGFDCNDPVFLTLGSPIDFIGIIISLT